jgi:hypothetical protein
MKVEVRDVPAEPAAATGGEAAATAAVEDDDPEELQVALSRITARLERLERLLVETR